MSTSTSTSTPVPALDLPSGTLRWRLDALRGYGLGLVSSSPSDVRSEAIPYLHSSDDKDDSHDSYDINLQGYSVSTKPLESLQRTSMEIVASSPQDTPWQRCFDAESSRYYLVNESTGETQWEEYEPGDRVEAEPTGDSNHEIGVVGKVEGGWEQCFDETTGKYYSYNPSTGESRWDEGEGAKGAANENTVSSGWCEYFDMDGNKYFYNEVVILSPFQSTFQLSSLDYRRIFLACPHY